MLEFWYGHFTAVFRPMIPYVAFCQPLDRTSSRIDLANLAWVNFTLRSAANDLGNRPTTQEMIFPCCFRLIAAICVRGSAMTRQNPQLCVGTCHPWSTLFFLEEDIVTHCCKKNKKNEVVFWFGFCGHGQCLDLMVLVFLHQYLRAH